MPKKIRELMRELEQAGFANRGDKKSHRNFLHPCGLKITISGKASADAKRYQEKLVEKKIQEAQQ
jgi:predicted RNA binding protein YcfA (HicA-like mRNA interferase family)